MESQNAPEKLQGMLQELYDSKDWKFFRRDFHHEGDGEDRETVPETHDEWHDHLESLGFLVLQIRRTTPDTTLEQALYWANKNLGAPLHDPRGRDPKGHQYILVARPALAIKALALGLPRRTGLQ